MYRRCSNLSCDENRQETQHPSGTKFCSECGSKTDVVFMSGDIINISATKQAKILKKLSHHTDAGMSTVYLAERTNERRAKAVVKIAKATKQTATTALEREVAHLKKLRHRHIIRLREGQQGVWHDEKDGQALYFTALEHLTGGSLKDRLTRSGRLDFREAVAIIAPIAEALDYIHGQDVIHLDVKPSNIMFRDGGAGIVLSDFGVSRTQADLNRISGPLGTPPYNAPELWKRNAKADKRVDIYALGITFYEMLLGNCPVRITSGDISSGENAVRRRIEELPPPSKTLPHLPPDVHRIIDRALHKDRNQRYSRASDFAAALQVIAPQVPDNGRNPRGLVVVLAALGIALVVGLAALGWIWFYDPAEPIPSIPTATAPAGATIKINSESTVVALDNTPTPTATSHGDGPYYPDDTPVSPTATLSRGQNPGVTATLAATPTAAPNQPDTGSTTLPTPASADAPDGQLTVLSPRNDFNISSDSVEFRWQYTGSSDCVWPDGQFFELRIWPDLDYKTPQGAMDAKQEADSIQCDAETGTWIYTLGNIRHARGVVEAQNVQRFRWDVALVEVEPSYKPVAHSASRVINIPVR